MRAQNQSVRDNMRPIMTVIMTFMTAFSIVMKYDQHSSTKGAILYHGNTERTKIHSATAFKGSFTIPCVHPWFILLYLTWFMDETHFVFSTISSWDSLLASSSSLACLLCLAISNWYRPPIPELSMALLRAPIHSNLWQCCHQCYSNSWDASQNR